MIFPDQSKNNILGSNFYNGLQPPHIAIHASQFII